MNFANMNGSGSGEGIDGSTQVGCDCEFGDEAAELVALPEFAYLMLFQESFRLMALESCGSAPSLREVRGVMRLEWFNSEGVSRLSLGITAGGFSYLREAADPVDYTGLWRRLMFAAEDGLSEEYRACLDRQTGPERKVFACADLMVMRLPKVVDLYMRAVRVKWFAGVVKYEKPVETPVQQAGVFPEGYCYLHAIPARYREQAAMLLRSDPLEASVARFLEDTCGEDRAVNVSARRCGDKLHAVPKLGALWRPRVDSLATVGNASSVLTEWLAQRVGGVDAQRVPASDVVLVTKSTAFHDHAQKQRFRMLEMLGDTVLTQLLVQTALVTGQSVQTTQELRSVRLSNAGLSRLFVESFPTECFIAPSGVDFGSTSAGAKALEAVVGAVQMACGREATVRLAVALFGDIMSCGESRPAGGLSKADERGFGYLHLFRPSVWSALVRRFGPDPMLEDLFRVDETDLQKESWPYLLVYDTAEGYHLSTRVLVPGARKLVDALGATINAGGTLPESWHVTGYSAAGLPLQVMASVS